MNFLTEKNLMILMFLLFSKAIIFSQESTNSNQIDLELGFSTGPAIGEKIPEFSLPDQSGQLKHLKDLIGKKGAVLNLYRSAEW